jgi:hypothetical protein
VGWTGRRCATGCIATTQVMLPAWRLRRGLGVRRPALSDEQMAELKDIVIQGPDPEKDGVVRWRCIDLRVKIVAHFAVTFSPTQRGQAVAQARPDALAAAAVPSEERRCGAGGS